MENGDAGELTMIAKIDLSKIEQDIRDIQRRFDTTPINLKVKVDDSSLREIVNKIQNAVTNAMKGGGSPAVGGSAAAVSGFPSGGFSGGGLALAAAYGAGGTTVRRMDGGVGGTQSSYQPTNVYGPALHGPIMGGMLPSGQQAALDTNVVGMLNQTHSGMPTNAEQIWTHSQLLSATNSGVINMQRGSDGTYRPRQVASHAIADDGGFTKALTNDYTHVMLGGQTIPRDIGENLYNSGMAHSMFRNEGSYAQYSGRDSSINSSGGVGNADYGPPNRPRNPFTTSIGDMWRNKPDGTPRGGLPKYMPNAPAMAGVAAYAAADITKGYIGMQNAMYANVRGDPSANLSAQLAFADKLDSYTGGTGGIVDYYTGNRRGNAMRTLAEGEYNNEFTNKRASAMVAHKFTDAAVLSQSENYIDQRRAVSSQNEAERGAIQDKYRKERDALGLTTLSADDKKVKSAAITKMENTELTDANRVAAARLGRMDRDTTFTADMISQGNFGQAQSNIAASYALKGNGVGAELTALQGGRINAQTQFMQATRGLDAKNPIYAEAAAQRALQNQGIDIAQQQTLKNYGLGLQDLNYSIQGGQAALQGDFKGAAMAGIAGQRERARATMPSGEFARYNQTLQIQERFAQLTETNRARGARLTDDRLGVATAANELEAGGQHFAAQIASISGNTKADIEGVQSDTNLNEEEKKRRIDAINKEANSRLGLVDRGIRRSQYGGTAANLGNYINFANESAREREPEEDLNAAARASEAAAKGMTSDANATKGKVSKEQAENGDLVKKQQQDMRGFGGLDAKDMGVLATNTAEMVRLLQDISRGITSAMTAQ